MDEIRSRFFLSTIGLFSCSHVYCMCDIRVRFDLVSYFFSVGIVYVYPEEVKSNTYLANTYLKTPHIFPHSSTKCMFKQFLHTEKMNLSNKRSEGERSL